ncbi:MAG: sigma-70 family RNA polymerase sigma factor [Planctomycetales bacterium]|nr:sigma-70 family RNA polymerase sigma factor [Planctomycetales bacterium]NIM08404.1 sigma-70 family RNA polymerase sigma factor [Planctomycetales bacterium]NIN07879.1 sigma-70 family RNA polymerase sigma factor [Planctomycetales bacterium]NIN77009.1 sigma-70 family RNA polymerase sigma factor [Planctomycetales bacterium]NIO34192.1 sigma-70 family RNA polymerase sigma factor [Planctomycetales bacterium]
MWPASDQTQQLIAQAQEGDDQAVNRLLDRHREAVRRMISLRMDRQLQQRVDASDIVQEVLVDANRRMAEYLRDPAMPFHLWLRQMAQDRLIDAHRRHRVAAKRSVEREQRLVARPRLDRSTLDLAAQLCDGQRTPAAAAEWNELQVLFQSALQQLEEKDREVVVMRHFEKLSNSEVAAALDLSPPAASMRYLRAVRRLREILARDNSSVS